MTILLTPLSIVGLLSVMYLLFILANLSRRLGAVRKMPPYYRGFYAAMGLLAIAIITRIMYSNRLAPSNEAAWSWLHNEIFCLTAYHIPAALALTISVSIAWHYWGWLIREPQ